MTDSIGEQLKKARTAQRLSLEQAAQLTRIKLHYLQALEKDDFNVLPSRVQQRGFLRSYGELLRLPVESLLAQLDGDLIPPASVVTAPDQAQEQQESALSRSESDLLESASIVESEPTGAQGILRELGSQLRRQREALGLTLEDVEQNTHLRLRYLNALESGRLHDLPSPVQGRGMLNNYAVFLGLEPEPVLLRYAEGLQAVLKSRQEARREIDSQANARKHSPISRAVRVLPGPLRKLFSSELWVVTFLVVFLVGFIVWAALRISQIQSAQEVTLTAPSIAEVLALDTSTPTASPSPEPNEALPESGLLEENVGATPTLAAAEVEGTPTEISTPNFEAAASGRIQLYLVARQRAWTRVVVDGKVEFDGRVLAGSAYLFTGDERIELVTGNGAALQVFLNRQDLGPLGIFGQVVERVFTREGMQTPTPAVPPTATPTPTPEVTITLAVTDSPANITPSPTDSIP
jgi:cytoskeleton protein RodZ